MLRSGAHWRDWPYRIELGKVIAASAGLEHLAEKL
jgi:hypothetical protein